MHFFLVIFLSIIVTGRAYSDFEDANVPAPASSEKDAGVAPTPASENQRGQNQHVHPSPPKELTPPSGNPSKPNTNKSSSIKGSSANNSAQGGGSEDGIEHNSSAPVSYSAQSLEGSLSQGRILLKGDVEIEQADAVMKSDVAEIFSNKGASTPQRAVAKGRVSLKKAATTTTQELRAVASELEYFISTRKVILKGKPKIWRGRELLQGEVIEVFLDTNEIKVRGARGVMEPATGQTSSTGNSPAGGIQTAPVKKSSQTGRK